MRQAKGIAFAAAFGLMPMIAHAEPWSGEFALGYLATTGNSDTSSVNAKGALVYAAERWKNTLTASAINTYADRESSAENYAATEQADFNFTPRDYAFVALEWNKDLFAAIRERTSETTGYGRHVLVGPAHLLDLELGAGARQLQTNDHPRERESDFIGRAALKYQWNITQTATLHQSLKVEAGESNTYTESVTRLKLSIIGNLFANLSYTLKNNSNTAPDTEQTDTETAVTLSYQFGKDQG
jgi:putative salt-induced outer membrane protein